MDDRGAGWYRAIDSTAKTAVGTEEIPSRTASGIYGRERGVRVISGLEAEGPKEKGESSWRAGGCVS